MKTFIVIAAFILTLGLYFEFNHKVHHCYNEKIYDLTLQYNFILQNHQNLIDLMIEKVLQDDEVLQIISDANENIDKDLHRERLYQKYKEHYDYLVNKGILQLHFHLQNGESFLRFHKPERYGDDLSTIRPSILEVHKTHAPVTTYEIGRFFDGFRYLFPIMRGDTLIGTVECSASSRAIIKTMQRSLDADYSIILKRSILEEKLEPDHLQHYFHTVENHPDYLIRNDLPVNPLLSKTLASEIKPHLTHNDPFVIYHFTNLTEGMLLVFKPIQNLQGDTIGYLIADRPDDAIIPLVYEHLFKFLVLLVSLAIILTMIRKNRRTQFLLEQYKSAVDRSTLVSKTDPSGVITYVNDSFEKISGYTKEELVGKPHKIVRSPSMPKQIFKDMWRTIQSGNTWYGKITNNAKDGTPYTVNATIIPIIDRTGKIEEYIAIRHDITELEELRTLLEHQLDSSIQDRDEKRYLLQQYEEAINSTAVLSRTDPQGNITYINDTYKQISGYDIEEMIGHSFHKVRAPDMPDSFYEQLWDTIRDNRTWHGVIPNIAKDGKPFYLDTTIVPIHDRLGNIREFMAIHYDVTASYELQQEIVDTQKEVVFTMGAIGESRSKETGNHVKRVAQYSYLLALHYGLDGADVKLLKQASPMHDIGKIGIPDAILKKPGPLTEEEWDVMKTHTKLGHQMLQHSKRPILEAASIVAREHHEKWDGSGYPLGLKGEEIHIFGRITAIADVFDALGSDRVYKSKWEDEKIFELFRQERGKHFDPELIDIFFEHLDEFLAVREQFKDI